jgi:hypothetical protein
MLDSFRKKWVSPFYLNVLHGNYATDLLTGGERERFNANVDNALSQITAEIALKLIRGGWREAITGSWLAGLKQIPECQSQISKLLLASRTCYAGQSHAFAMACYADEFSAKCLVDYLDTYLRKLECYYDQNWAMPALMWIDSELGTTYSERFLSVDGLWHHFTKDKISKDHQAWTIESCRDSFWRSMPYCRQQFQRPHKNPKDA